MRAIPSAAGEGSTIADSLAEVLPRITRMCSRPISPAPATAIANLLMVLGLRCDPSKAYYERGSWAKTGSGAGFFGRGCR